MCFPAAEDKRVGNGISVIPTLCEASLVPPEGSSLQVWLSYQSNDGYA
jgi:hypothetical protein